MDKQEARRILREHLTLYRQRSYQELLTLLDRPETFEVRSGSGVLYQLEFQVFWDDPGRQTLRVLGSIDDGGIRAVLPLNEDFIMAPGGTFVGE
jgi:hypothetical protein